MAPNYVLLGVLIAVFAYMLYRSRRGFLEMWGDAPPVERALLVAGNVGLLAGMILIGRPPLGLVLIGVAIAAIVVRVVLWSRRTRGMRP